MKKNRKKIFRLLLIFVVLLFLFANRGFRSLVRQYLHYRYLQKELNRVKKENQNLEQQLPTLEKDFSAIERIARTKLNFVKPGEIIYRFVPQENTPSPNRSKK